MNSILAMSFGFSPCSIKYLPLKGRHPWVHLIVKTYRTGIRLTQQAMQQLEQRLERLPTLPKWFVRITPQSV